MAHANETSVAFVLPDGLFNLPNSHLSHQLLPKSSYQTCAMVFVQLDIRIHAWCLFLLIELPGAIGCIVFDRQQHDFILGSCPLQQKQILSAIVCIRFILWNIRHILWGGRVEIVPMGLPT